MTEGPPAAPPAADREARNTFWLECYQVVVRIGWIFKTETIIMPAVLDAVVDSGFLRGLLPVASVPWYDARELAGPLAVLGAVIAAGLAFSFAFRPGAAAARRLAEHLDAAP